MLFGLAFISVLAPVYAETYEQVSAADAHTCALLASGGVQCWGFNGSGQLGNGTTTSSSTPVPVYRIGSGATEVTAGYGHSCARLSSGQVRCWGSN